VNGLVVPWPSLSRGAEGVGTNILWEAAQEEEPFHSGGDELAAAHDDGREEEGAVNDECGNDGLAGVEAAEASSLWQVDPEWWGVMSELDELGANKPLLPQTRHTWTSKVPREDQWKS